MPVSCGRTAQSSRKNFTNETKLFLIVSQCWYSVLFGVIHFVLFTGILRMAGGGPPKYVGHSCPDCRAMLIPRPSRLGFSCPDCYRFFTDKDLPPLPKPAGK
eukprot:g69502.t1